VGGDYNTPAQVEQWLAQGIGKIVGHPDVDGHQTVELSISAGPAKTYVLFADVHTYQVVRTIDYFNQVSQAPPITANYPSRAPVAVRASDGCGGLRRALLPGLDFES
jgi:hypothetical protein